MITLQPLSSRVVFPCVRSDRVPLPLRAQSAPAMLLNIPHVWGQPSLSRVRDAHVWGQRCGTSPSGTLFEPPGTTRKAMERLVHSYGWRFTVAATSLAVSFQLTAPIASMIASQSQLIHALTILPPAT